MQGFIRVLGLIYSLSRPRTSSL